MKQKIKIVIIFILLFLLGLSFFYKEEIQNIIKTIIKQNKTKETKIKTIKHKTLKKTVEKKKIIKDKYSYNLNIETNKILYGQKYKRVIFLDKNNLTGVYNALHDDKHNYNNDTAFVLKTDLDFTKLKQQFVPMGGRHIPFAASFFGNGHIIKVGSITYDWKDNTGFFGNIQPYLTVIEDKKTKELNNKRNVSIISDFTLILDKIKGRYNVGGLVGNCSDCKISNVSVIANSIQGGYAVGGLVGRNSGTITNSSTKIGSFKINPTKHPNNDFGGFVGNNVGNIIECYSIVDNIIIPKAENVGGFVGNNEKFSANISYSFSKVKKVKGQNNVGNFIGYNVGNLDHCYSITEDKNNLNKFVGRNNGGKIKEFNNVYNYKK